MPIQRTAACFEKSRQHLVKLADEHSLDLRQNYNREAPRLAAQVARYAHAKQYKCMKKAIRTQKPKDKNKLYAVHAPEVEIPDVRILRSGQRRGITRTLKKMIKRRSAIEPTIGHMKTDWRLDRNPLKGALGDALHAVLCGADHNIRLLLKKLKLLCAEIRQ